MYKTLIENKPNEHTFQTQVKPFLNKGEHYFKARTTHDDDIEPNRIIGFAYRCKLNDFMNDLLEWCMNNDYGNPDMIIYEKIMFSDGTCKTLNVYEF